MVAQTQFRFRFRRCGQFVKYSKRARLNQNVVEIKRLKIEFGTGEIEKHL